MFVTEEWQVFAVLLPLMAISLLCFPCLMGMGSNCFAESEQGEGLSVFAAARGMGFTIGPVVFAQAYARFKRGPYDFPRA
eukprot:gene727-13495_t